MQDTLDLQDVPLRNLASLFVARAVPALLLGIMLLVLAKIMGLLLILVFGVFAVLQGAGAVISGLTVRKMVGTWWSFLIEGIAGIVIGAFSIAWPGIAFYGMLFLIAVWALITGGAQLVFGTRFGKAVSRYKLFAFPSILGLLLCIVLLLLRSPGLPVVAWLLGAYGVLLGAGLTATGFYLKGMLHPRKT